MRVMILLSLVPVFTKVNLSVTENLLFGGVLFWAAKMKLTIPMSL